MNLGRVVLSAWSSSPIVAAVLSCIVIGASPSVGRAQEPPGPDYEQRIQIERRRIVLGERIFFEHGRGKLLAVSHSILDALARKLRASPAIERLQIEGHTDTTGPREVNQRLSAFRARAVRDYLVEKGVPELRLVTRGFGEEWPVATNSTQQGRERNRRVELVILEVLKRNVWRRRPPTRDYVVVIRASAGAEERGPEGAAVPLEADHPLYVGDTIETPRGATAVVRFPGIALAYVAAESALRIERIVGSADGEGRLVTLRLARGAVRLRGFRARKEGGPLITLKVAGATLSTEVGEVRIVREAGGARFEARGGVSQVVAAGAEYTLREGDGLRVDTIAATASSHVLPRGPGQRAVLARPQGDTKLTWGPSTGAMAYVVEVARDVDFLDIVTRQERDSPSLDFTLPAGTYHWRVRVRDSAGFEGLPWPQLTFEKK